MVCIGLRERERERETWWHAMREAREGSGEWRYAMWKAATNGRGSMKTVTTWGVAVGKTTADLVVAGMVSERKNVSE